MRARSINVHFVTKAKPWISWSPFPAETMHRMLLDAVDPGWRRARFNSRAESVRWKFAAARPLSVFFSLRARLKKNPASDLRTSRFWSGVADDLSRFRRRFDEWRGLQEGWRREIEKALV